MNYLFIVVNQSSSENTKVNSFRLSRLIDTLVGRFIFVRSPNVLCYIILLSSWGGGGVRGGNTGVNIFPDSPPLCRCS